MNFLKTSRFLARFSIAGVLFSTMMACSSLREGDDEVEEVAESNSSPRKRLSDEGITKVDYNKKFDKKSLNLSKTFSDTPEKGGERSRFQSARYNNPENSIEASRYNTERYTSGTDQEPVKKKRSTFFGVPSKVRKQAEFAEQRSHGETEAYTTSPYSHRSEVNAIYGTRSERDVTERYFSNESQGTGEPAPMIINQPSLSEGDIRSLLNGP